MGMEPINGVKEMKKLLHITEAMAGGVLIFLADLNRYLKDKYEIVIAYGIRNNTPEDLSEYFDENIRLIQLEELTSHMNIDSMLRGWRAMRRVIRQEKADVIHLHSSAAGILGRLGQCYYGADVFYTPHSYFFQNPDISRSKRNFFYLTEKLLTYTSVITVACGMGEYELAKKMTRKSRCIENGIDIRQIDDMEEKRAGDATCRQRLVMYASGRICEHKNPQLFNEIAMALPDCSFVWIGDGEMRDVLNAPNIEVTGHLTHTQALAKAMECDIFLLTSTYEGLPLSLLEAMYLNKIPVVNQIDGIKGLIIDKENGYVCKTKDEMAERIVRIRESGRQETEEILKNARKLIADRYTAEYMAENYCSLYDGKPMQGIRR